MSSSVNATVNISFVSKHSLLCQPSSSQKFPAFLNSVILFLQSDSPCLPVLKKSKTQADDSGSKVWY